MHKKRKTKIISRIKNYLLSPACKYKTADQNFPKRVHINWPSILHLDHNLSEVNAFLTQANNNIIHITSASAQMNTENKRENTILSVAYYRPFEQTD